MADMGYLTLLFFPGRHPSFIYFHNYLSAMFSISDATVDKEEISTALSIHISIPGSRVEKIGKHKTTTILTNAEL